MLLIIGTPDENKTGLYFSRYEHVYLCIAIKRILIVDEYLQDYFINIHSCSEFHTTTQKFVMLNIYTLFI